MIGDDGQKQRLITEYTNHDLTTVVTPVNVVRLKQLLEQTRYGEEETNFLVQGFTHGFSLGYQGPLQRKSRSRNLSFTIGDKYVMWEKIMKEVQAGRYAGPYTEIPFENYIQLPIGLVPKDGGKQTRLIFHLSYNFSENLERDGSLNYFTPREICTIHYRDPGLCHSNIHEVQRIKAVFLVQNRPKVGILRVAYFAQ